MLFLLAAFLVCAAAAATAQKKGKGPVLYVLPPQTVEVADVQPVAPAQPCANWQLAAALETVVRRLDLPFDQRFWIGRVYPGEVCESRLDVAQWLERINGDYRLHSGRNIRLRLDYAPGAPSTADTLMKRIRDGQLQILLRRGRPLLLVGGTYQEQVGSNNYRLSIIRELRLLDPSDPAGKSHEPEAAPPPRWPEPLPAPAAESDAAPLPAVWFVAGRDDPAEIDGVLTVSVWNLNPDGHPEEGAFTDWK